MIDTTHLQGDRCSGSRAKKLAAVSTAILVGLGIWACGGNSKDATRLTAAGGATPAAAAGGATSTKITELKRDADKDRDNPAGSYYDRDDISMLQYGHEATGSDNLTITSTVKRYLVAAAAADGTAACRLLNPVLAEAIPEDYGHATGAPALRGNTCSIVMSKLFKLAGRRLTQDASLVVTGVRIQGNQGWVLLSTGLSKPNRFVRMHRKGRTWLIGAPLPVGLP
jgi:hypothetical protein